jgi:hypothetical protein
MAKLVSKSSGWQFHATKEEIIKSLNDLQDSMSLFIAAYSTNPFCVEIAPEVISSVWLDKFKIRNGPTANVIVLAQGEFIMDAKSQLDFHTKNSEIVTLTVGTQSPDELHESAMGRISDEASVLKIYGALKRLLIVKSMKGGICQSANGYFTRLRTHSL